MQAYGLFQQEKLKHCTFLTNVRANLSSEVQVKAMKLSLFEVKHKFTFLPLHLISVRKSASIHTSPLRSQLYQLRSPVISATAGLLTPLSAEHRSTTKTSSKSRTESNMERGACQCHVFLRINYYSASHC